MNSDTPSGSPFPDQIDPPPEKPTPGNDIQAVDYRTDPSHGQAGALQSANDRDHPAAGGDPVGPPPDRSIQSYDLPSQLRSYDRMGESR